MTRELYIYWKPQPGHEAQAMAAAAAMQQALQSQHPGLTARLLQRSDAGAAPTVMEIYIRKPLGIDPALENLIAVAALCLEPHIAPKDGRPGMRHVEAFTAV